MKLERKFKTALCLALAGSAIYGISTANAREFLGLETKLDDIEITYRHSDNDDPPSPPSSDSSNEYRGHPRGRPPHNEPPHHEPQRLDPPREDHRAPAQKGGHPRVAPHEQPRPEDHRAPAPQGGHPRVAPHEQQPAPKPQQPKRIDPREEQSHF